MRYKIIPSFPAYNVSETGVVRRNRTVLNLGRTFDGYPRCGLKRDGKWFYRTVHVLVCEAFHGQKPTPKHEVCHIDGTKTNNHISNLRWGTRADNYADRVRHGTCNRGERMGWSKLTEKQVLEILKKNKNGISYSKLMKEYGVSKSCIWGIISGPNWKHVKPLSHQRTKP